MMRLPMTLTAILCGAFLFSAMGSDGFAQDEAVAEVAKAKPLAEQLIGTWVLSEAQNPGRPSGIGTRLKMFTGTHWSVLQPDANTGIILFQHGGTYTLKGNTMTTQRKFAGQSTKFLIGTTGKLKIEIDGDTMKQGDADGVYNEIWKRVK